MHGPNPLNLSTVGGPGTDIFPRPSTFFSQTVHFLRLFGKKILKSFLGGAEKSKRIFFKNSDVSDFWLFDFRK